MGLMETLRRLHDSNGTATCQMTHRKNFIVNLLPKSATSDIVN